MINVNANQRTLADGRVIQREVNAAGQGLDYVVFCPIPAQVKSVVRTWGGNITPSDFAWPMTAANFMRVRKAGLAEHLARHMHPVECAMRGVGSTRLEVCSLSVDERDLERYRKIAAGCLTAAEADWRSGNRGADTYVAHANAHGLALVEGSPIDRCQYLEQLISRPASNRCDR